MQYIGVIVTGSTSSIQRYLIRVIPTYQCHVRGRFIFTKKWWTFLLFSFLSTEYSKCGHHCDRLDVLYPTVPHLCLSDLPFPFYRPFSFRFFFSSVFNFLPFSGYTDGKDINTKYERRKVLYPIVPNLSQSGVPLPFYRHFYRFFVFLDLPLPVCTDFEKIIIIIPTRTSSIQRRQIYAI